MIWVVAWRIGRLLPTWLVNALLNVLCPFLVKRGSVNTTLLHRHLTAVHPELNSAQMTAMVLDNVRSYGRYWAEVFELSTERRELLLERVIVHNHKRLADAHERGKGVVVALPHVGNWDLAGAWVAQYFPVTTVAEKVEPTALFTLFTKLRKSLGMSVVPLDSGMAALSMLRTALESGGLVCLVADRVVSGSVGIDVELVGARSVIPAGPATLAYQTGAALIPVSLYYRGRAMHVDFQEEVTVQCDAPRRAEVQRATQSLADSFTAIIKEHAVDWRALQPIFTDEKPAVTRS